MRERAEPVPTFRAERRHVDTSTAQRCVQIRVAVVALGYCLSFTASARADGLLPARSAPIDAAHGLPRCGCDSRLERGRAQAGAAMAASGTVSRWRRRSIPGAGWRACAKPSPPKTSARDFLTFSEMLKQMGRPRPATARTC